jgi:superfamily II DNA or RNA helicase
MKEWVMPYQKEFKNWIISEYKKQSKEKGLEAHQSFVKNYLKDSPFHGILLFHGLGTGKTRSSIAICEGRGKDVFVLLPASIKVNFQSEIKKYIEDSNTKSTVKYEYIHYNGLTRSAVSEIHNSKTFFDNKTVVIDEIHNFVSMVKNGSYNAKRLYMSLMNAKNVVIVALTGTPILNSPEELGFIFNLIYGYIHTYTISLKKGASAKVLELQNCKEVSSVTLLDNQSTINYTLYPEGFVRDVNKPYTLIKGVHDPSLKKQTVESSHLFPQKSGSFRDFFVSNDGIQNTKMFTRRVQGIVSNYQQNESNTDYPEQAKLKIVKCEMTDHQFQTYSKMRNVEIALELGKSKKGGDNDVSFDKKEPSLYKTYTRACCNFVFPDEIPRPFSKQKLMNAKEMDEDITDYDNIDKDDDDDLEPLPVKRIDIKTAMALLKKSDFLNDMDKLQNCSPKMLQMFKRIHLKKNTGPVVVYSAFRNVEGVGIFTMMLERNGFVELTIKTIGGEKILENAKSPKPKFIVFTSNMETNRVLMDIFNNDLKNVPEHFKKQLPDNYVNLRGEYVKVILLTKSGSEGISLKNVRQVHIMEPYWNDIRVRQVIGRAVRAGSHAALPLAERKVSSYIYLTHFKESQKNANKMIKTRDGGLTTDEHVYAIAANKAKVNDAFLKLMQGTSIDCQLFNPDNCITPVGTSKGLMYPLGPIEKDLVDKKIQTKIKKTEYKYLTYPNPLKPGEFKAHRFLNKRTGKIEPLFYDDSDRYVLYFESTKNNASIIKIPDFFYSDDKSTLIENVVPVVPLDNAEPPKPKTKPKAK